MTESPQSNRERLQYLILFVTARCNARCATCFYWKELDTPFSELSVDEIRRISASIETLPTLLISGGEPTLREDLPEIVDVFFQQNRLGYVGVPTNGLLPNRARKFVVQILERCPGLRLDVNVSLDGIGEKHDAIRGVPGNFERALETIRSLSALRGQYESLSVNVETVLFKDNLYDIGALLDFVRSNLDVNGHYVELMRGNPRDDNIELPSPAEVRRIHRLVLKNHFLYHADPRKKRWQHELPYLRELYRWQQKCLRGRHWPALCPAGDDLAVIEPDGRVRACELRGTIGDLRKCDYDLGTILQSSEAEAERNAIADTKCSCTHCVFIYRTFFVHGLPSPWRRLFDRWYKTYSRFTGTPR